MRVAVIGAGLAGLAAACALADSGHAVTLLERRPWAGGKTYSFADPQMAGVIDNGQHIFMNCTSAYIDFLDRLGTLPQTKRQARLRVPVLDVAGRRSDLWAAALPAPLHLLPSFFAYRHLSPAEKVRILRGLPALMHSDPGDGALNQLTFADWLRRHGQTEREIERFWDLIVVPTLNCSAAEASAAQAIFVFREGFLHSDRSAGIGVARVGLSDLHVRPAIEYLQRRGGAFCPRAEVEAIEPAGRAVAALWVKGSGRQVFDAYVAALPPRQLMAILPSELRAEASLLGLSQFIYDPIVNLHLWFDAPVADFDFAAFTGSDLQWVFNRTRIEGGAPDSAEHLTVSLSWASRYLGESRRTLQDRFLPEIQRLLPRSRLARLLHFAAVKEPEATFRPAPGLSRPGAITGIENLFLAGAYTATGWPATMESAVRSGLAAAAAVQARAALARAEPQMSFR